MADLSLITREHVLQAAALIDKRGIENKDQSKEWDVLINGKRYPPKYVMRVAYRFPARYELSSQDTRTGVAQNRLRELGFKIVPK